MVPGPPAPVPRSPAMLSPQQYAAPAGVSAQVWLWPDAITAPKVAVPPTGTGTRWFTCEPLPSRYRGPYPQQYAMPLVVIAQLNASPPLTATKRRSPATRRGQNMSSVEGSPLPTVPELLRPQQR